MDTNFLIDVVQPITLALLSIGIIIGFILSVQLRGSNFILITVFLLLSLLFQSYQYYLSNNSINNIFLFHIYPILEFLLLVALLYSWNPSNKKYFILYATLVSVFVIGNSFFTSVHEFPSTSLFLIYTSLIFAFLFYLGNTSEEVLMSRNLKFNGLVASAFILYSVSIITSLLVIHYEEKSIFLYVHIITQILFYLVLIIAFLKEWFNLNYIKIEKIKYENNLPKVSH